VKLLDYKNDLARGVVLRCKGYTPYESIVDFMIVEYSVSGKREYALMVVTGYKAGLIFVILPSECEPTENIGSGISLNWLKLNWTKWGYSECPLEDVHVLEYCSPPALS
jgi:hypothetical protein